MNTLTKAYYKATAFVPRKLPTTGLEYAKMKDILHQAHGLPDSPQVWATVSGVISATPHVKVRRPYSHIVNSAKRLEINKLAQEDKLKAIADLERMLKEAAKKAAKEAEESATKDAAAPVLEGTLEASPT